MVRNLLQVAAAALGPHYCAMVGHEEPAMLLVSTGQVCRRCGEVTA